MTLDHLREARDQLRAAQNAEDAGLGTELMIGGIINDLNELIENTEEIKDDDNGSE